MPPPKQLPSFLNWRDASAALALLCLAWFWHRGALDGFWRADDGFHLLFAVRHQAWEYFFTQGGLLGFSGANITPWNPLFYNINLALFGWVPRWHYAHLLALTGAGVLLSYALLRHWLGVALALLGAALFTVGLPTYWVNQTLMTAHYAMGLVFCALALIAYRRSDSRAWRLAGPVCYLLSCLCKEIYVPLLVFLPFVRPEDARAQWRRLLPYGVVLAGYALLRLVVLGSLMGGYGIVLHGAHDRLRQLGGMPALLLGGGLSGALALFALAGVLGFAVVRSRRRLALFALCCVAVGGPIVALTAFPGVRLADRYLYALWWGLSLALPLCLPSVTHRAGVVVAGLLALLVGSAVLRTSLQGRAQADQMIALTDTLYRASTDLPSGAFLVPPASGMGYVSEALDNYRLAYQRFHPGAAAGAQVVTNEEEGYAHLPPDARLLRYAPDCLCLVDISAQREQLRAIGRKNLDAYVAGKTMRVRFAYRHGVVRWDFSGDFGAADKGRFRMVDAQGRMIDIGAQGSVGASQHKKVRFRVDYVADAGWKTSSVYFDFDPIAQPVIDWRGATLNPHPR